MNSNRGTKSCETLKIILYVLIAALIVACAVHTSVAYYLIASDPFTSFPSTAALLIIVPYAVAIATAAGALVVMKIINKRNNR